MDAATGLQRLDSRSAWLGAESVDAGHRHRWVSLDERARAYWLNAKFGEAWELVCLHSGVDPYPLQALRAYLSMGRDSALDLRLVAYKRRRPPPLLARRHALSVNLGKAQWAIAQGELPSLVPPEREWVASPLPLMRRVDIDEFRQWVLRAALLPTLAWPDKSADERRSGSRRNHQPDQLVVDVVNNPLRLMKAVKEQFRRRYQAGHRQTPTKEEVGRFLVDTLGEPSNLALAASISQFLTPDSTPPGPRQRGQRP